MCSFKQDLFHLYGKLQRLYSCSCMGDKQYTSNYRLISILPMVSKILEKAVNFQLYAFLTENNLCSPNRFRFSLKSSTVTSSSQLSDEIVHLMVNGCLTRAMFLDLPKAFDTVSHSILLQKVSSLGTNSAARDWFSSFLINRNQVTNWVRPHPNWCGSILVPLSFRIFISIFWKFCSSVMPLCSILLNLFQP